MRRIRDLFRRKNAESANDAAGGGNAPQVRKAPGSVPADNPITQPEDDALGRLKPARSFADQVLALDSAEGVVVGVLGPWGSGKTSFVNLARRRLEEAGATVLEFNPWMFSGADQLVQSFFVELSAQLKLQRNLAEIGKLVEEYGDTFAGLGWLPLVGPWIERGRAASKLLAKLLQRKKEGISGQQKKIRAALAKLENPIVVILDDIDRLTTTEIRDIFKLVRLTANFPNVIYLLAFDRARVEQALGEQGIPGRDYLEKILQLAVDLPVVPVDVLNSQIIHALNSVLAKVENAGELDQKVWPDVFMEIIQPNIRHMRDVRRYAAAVHGTIRDLGGKIALADVLALEAVRVFLPEVFRGMQAAVDALTTTSDVVAGRENEERLKGQIEALVKAGGERSEVVRDLIQRLFLAAQRHIDGNHYGSEWKNGWLREKRVAHEDFLRLYLERVEGEHLQAFTDAENAWARMTDGPAFEGHLRSLPIERLRDVISSLEAYEDQFGPEHVVPGVVVLLNLLPDMPEQKRGMFDPGTTLVVGRVVYRLIRALKNPQAVEDAVRDILPRVSSLSSKFELITDVGYREGAGHKLVAEGAAKELEKEWRAEVRAASAEALAKETELLQTLIHTKRDAGPGEPALAIPDSPVVTKALLRAARAETRSQTVGTRVIRRKARLHWNGLVELYGDEATLRSRIEALKASRPDNIGDLLALADKYLAGWRPNDRDE